MSDIVERLRIDRPFVGEGVRLMCLDAADEIERLEAQITALSTALREALYTINAMIVRGPLPGNGTDKTAQRNGLILASNAINALLSGERK